MLIVQSGVRRGLVDGAYNAPPRRLRSGGKALGLPSLRDASLDAIDAAPASTQSSPAARATWSAEIARVRAAVDAIDRRDIVRSRRTDARQPRLACATISKSACPVVDRLVDLLNGAIGDHGGARMTGGGFGGAVVAVLPLREAERVRAASNADYRTARRSSHCIS